MPCAVVLCDVDGALRPTRLEQDLARQGLDSLAHTVVNTARIGVAKSGPRVYRIAAERVGVTAERCLLLAG